MKKIAIASGVLGLVSSTLVACSPAFQNDTAIEGNQGNQNSELNLLAVIVGDLGNPFFVLMGRERRQKQKK